MPPPPTIKGYHGTDAAFQHKILNGGFKPTTGREWLGPGVYFFVEGISSQGPVKDAVRWADFRRYRFWSVMSAEIKTEKMLDLTDEGAMQVFNEIRDDLYARMNFQSRDHGRENLIDVEILEEIAKTTEVWVVKCHFFIKFAVENRKNIGSRIPNVTIICVSHPEGAIVSNSIRLYKTQSSR